jgi:hypothetical protein
MSYSRILRGSGSQSWLINITVILVRISVHGIYYDAKGLSAEVKNLDFEAADRLIDKEMLAEWHRLAPEEGRSSDAERASLISNEAPFQSHPPQDMFSRLREILLANNTPPAQKGVRDSEGGEGSSKPNHVVDREERQSSTNVNAEPPSGITEVDQDAP